MAEVTREYVREVLRDWGSYDCTGFWDSLLRDYPYEDELREELKHRWYMAERREQGE